MLCQMCRVGKGLLWRGLEQRLGGRDVPTTIVGACRADLEHKGGFRKQGEVVDRASDEEVGVLHVLSYNVTAIFADSACIELVRAGRVIFYRLYGYWFTSFYMFLIERGGVWPLNR